MLLRILVFIFALNAFAPPAMAFTCDMMNDADMVSMPHDMTSMSHEMSGTEMECSMDQDHSCNSTECITACAASFSLLIIDDQKSFATNIISKHPKDNLLSLYEVYLPINTPPPLV